VLFKPFDGKTAQFRAECIVLFENEGIRFDFNDAAERGYSFTLRHESESGGILDYYGVRKLAVISFRDL